MVDWHELEESEKREFAQRELLGDQPSQQPRAVAGRAGGRAVARLTSFPTQRYRLYHGKFLHEPKKLGAGV